MTYSRRLPQAQVRLHLPRQMLPDGDEVLPPFYVKLVSGLEALGADVSLHHRDMDALRAPNQSADFDLVYNGNIDRPRALNLGPAYLNRFHYMDPKGIFGDSSMMTRQFNPEAMPPQKAAEFFAKLQQIFVQTRRSRQLQPQSQESFDGGHIAVFLQDISDPVLRFRHMSARQMIEGLLATGKPLVVKPHPRNLGAETDAILTWLDQEHPAQARISIANLHDILPGAIATASIGSSVALEGMLPRVPALLFGTSDLHHCATSVKAPADTAAALARALARNWPYEAFLFWFLRRNMIWASRPFMRDVLARMHAQGADLDALGISQKAV